MSEYQPYVESLHDHYEPLVRADPQSFRAVDWGSRESQFLRFSVLCGIGDVLDASILDVGCGVGHFVDYLKEIGHRGAYLGIDALPAMVDAARSRHPDHRFEVGLPDRQRAALRADYVFASGVLVFSDWDISCAMVAEMFALASVGCAYNSLSTWTPDRFAGEFQWNPSELLDYAHTLTPWVALRHDYLVHDVTLFLYHHRRTQ